jgi:WD40 repeat protein
MKKSILVLFIFVLLFMLSLGCTAAEKEITEETVEPTATPQPVAVQTPVEEAPVEEAEAPITIGDPELVWSEKHENSLHSIAVTGETVAVGEYKVTYIHHLADGSLVNVLVHEHAVEDTKFSVDEMLLGAGQGYYGVLLTNIADGTDPVTIGGGHNSRLAFSPGGLTVATGNRDGIVWIWQLDDLQQTAVLENPEVPDKAIQHRWVLAIDYHPSGKLLAVTHTDGTVYIWDLENEAVSQTLQYSADVSASNTFRFSPNGSDMAVAAKEGTDHLIRLYALDGGAVIRDLNVPERVSNLDFSPDGSLLAVASRQATTIWDVASGALLYTLNQTITPPDNTPVALTFSPDGGHIAVARWDGTLELWRLPGAEPIAPPPVDIRVPPPLPGDVLFDTGSAALKETAFAELETLAQDIYASFKTAAITFIGHTDSRGDADSNKKLSIDRAAAIKNWFQSWADTNGADGWTLLVDGKGKTELKVPDTNVEGHFLEDAGALNRRVEIEIDPGE